MGCSDGDNIPDLFEPPSQVGVFMAGAQPVQNPGAFSGSGANGSHGQDDGPVNRHG